MHHPSSSSGSGSGGGKNNKQTNELSQVRKTAARASDKRAHSAAVDVTGAHARNGADACRFWLRMFVLRQIAYFVPSVHKLAMTCARAHSPIARVTSAHDRVSARDLHFALTWRALIVSIARALADLCSQRCASSVPTDPTERRVNVAQIVRARALANLAKWLALNA